MTEPESSVKNGLTPNIEAMTELLLQGVEVWNTWREINTIVFVGLGGAKLAGANLSRANLCLADLAGADLAGADLAGADLAGAKLTEANLADANLAGADLAGAKLAEADLTGATLTGATLTGANLVGAKLGGADLARADLSSANFSTADLSRANLDEVNLTEAKLVGATLGEANLSRANLSKAKLVGAKFGKAKLMEATLVGADLDGADLDGADLDGADLGGADLGGADLTEAKLTEAKLGEAYLIQTNLSRANLSKAKLVGATLIGADLAGANLTVADLAGANLGEANLAGVILDEADLAEANLAEANLAGANLAGANLAGANLSKVNLSKANLSRAKLHKVNLSGAVIDEHTRYWKAKGCVKGVNGIYCDSTKSLALMTLTPPADSMKGASANAVVESLKHSRSLHTFSITLAAFVSYIAVLKPKEIKLPLIDEKISPGDFGLFAMPFSICCLTLMVMFMSDALNGARYLRTRDDAMTVSQFPWALSRFSGKGLVGKFLSFFIRFVMAFHPAIYLVFLFGGRWTHDRRMFIGFGVFLLILCCWNFAISQAFQRPILFDQAAEDSAQKDVANLVKALAAFLKTNKSEKKAADEDEETKP